MESAELVDVPAVSDDVLNLVKAMFNSVMNAQLSFEVRGDKNTHYVDETLSDARTAYAKCMEVRKDFSVKVERVALQGINAEMGRTLRVTASWDMDGISIERVSSPRSFVMLDLAYFIRNFFTNCAEVG